MAQLVNEQASNGTANVTQPKWMEQFRTQFLSGVAHAFVFHFNTRDYMARELPLRDYLVKAMANKKVIAFYNLADGISFPKAGMREEFDKICELDSADAANAETNNVLAALSLDTPSNGPKPLPKVPAKAIPLLETLLRNGSRSDGDRMKGEVAVVLEFAETIAPNADVSMMSPDDRAVLVTLERLGADKDLASRGNPLILVTENVSDLHPALRRASSKFEQIEIALPGFDERKRFIQQLLERRGERLDEGLTVEALAASTAMLNRMHIEDVFLHASQNTGVITADLVRERKRSIIAAEFGEVIEVMEPSFTFADIGGLEHVKEFFVRSVIRPMKEGRYSRVPMGVLMTGPAGTGKTIMAQAVARESGMNCVILNPAKLFGQYVGNTERNLDRALRAIVAMSPTIVFMDEIDQVVNRGGGGDSGVSNRFFKRLLEFMSDTTHRGRVVFLAATNRPDLMDAALRRPGRFDRKIPFVIPNRSERVDIIRVMAKRYGLGEVELDTALIEDLQERTGGNDLYKAWTGAELEAATIKAFELTQDEGMTAQAALAQAVRRLRPSTSEIEFQTLLAMKECNDTDLLPPQYRERLADRAKLEEQIENAQPRGRNNREL